MASRIRNVTVDCHDPDRLAGFWALVLDLAEDPDDPNLPEDDLWLIRSADGRDQLLFIRVPDEVLPAKRIHLDVEPVDRTRDEEVTRLLALGATLVEDRRVDDGTGWVVLGDPEGNLFCVLRSPAERAVTGG